MFGNFVEAATHNTFQQVTCGVELPSSSPEQAALMRMSTCTLIVLLPHSLSLKYTGRAEPCQQEKYREREVQAYFRSLSGFWVIFLLETPQATT